MMSQKEYWENIYSVDELKYPVYDGWLDKYLDILKTAHGIMDLGCGNGVNMQFLAKNGLPATGCELSQKALDMLAKSLPSAKTSCFDMTEGLPFADESFDVIISDLSLHYFSSKATNFALNEMKRVLTKKGVLLCRLNSVKEYEQLRNGTELEPDFYLMPNGCTKRFFNRETVLALFSDWNIHYVDELPSDKYGGGNDFWELKLSKE